MEIYIYENINFLNVCLETSRNIIQRKKIYRKDYDFIMISLKLCLDFYNKDNNQVRYKDLYNKFLVILDLAYNKFN